MFNPSSRYYNLENATYTTSAGRVVVFKRRRFLPSIDGSPVLAELTIGQADRLDNIAARTLGNPELFWQICDANNAMHPRDLGHPGRHIKITLPQTSVS